MSIYSTQYAPMPELRPLTFGNDDAQEIVSYWRKKIMYVLNNEVESAYKRDYDTTYKRQLCVVCYPIGASIGVACGTLCCLTTILCCCLSVFSSNKCFSACTSVGVKGTTECCKYPFICCNMTEQSVETSTKVASHIRGYLEELIKQVKMEVQLSLESGVNHPDERHNAIVKRLYRLQDMLEVVPRDVCQAA